LLLELELEQGEGLHRVGLVPHPGVPVLESKRSVSLEKLVVHTIKSISLIIDRPRFMLDIG
jgi:hypothetical protein